MKHKIAITILLFIFALIQSKGQTLKNFEKLKKDSSCKVFENILVNDKEKIFTKLEVISEFPGAYEKWFEYAQKKFNFQCIARKLEDTVLQFQDSIEIKFVVTRTGEICNIQMLNGNSILMDPTVKLLNSSPLWIPGTNGNRNLHSFRRLKIKIIIDNRINSYLVKKDYYSYRLYN